MKKHRLSIVILVLALVFILPGIAIARQASSSNTDNSLPSQSNSVVLIGGEYNLVFQPVPPANGNSTNSRNLLLYGSHSQFLGQTTGVALQGGLYTLKPLDVVNDTSGCCCKNHLPCITK